MVSKTAYVFLRFFAFFFKIQKMLLFTFFELHTFSRKLYCFRPLETQNPCYAVGFAEATALETLRSLHCMYIRRAGKINPSTAATSKLGTHEPFNLLFA